MVLKSRSALVFMALRCKTPTQIVVEVYHTMSDGLGSIGSRFSQGTQSTGSEIERDHCKYCHHLIRNLADDTNHCIRSRK